MNGEEDHTAGGGQVPGTAGEVPNGSPVAADSSPFILIAFTPRQKAVCVVLALLWLLLTISSIHGYSLPCWQAFIDGKPSEAVLLGHPRAIRTDDWAVELPLALSQQMQQPPFPKYNLSIGEGVNQLAPVRVPIWHPLILFKPTTWGFFLGGDTGLAWAWWSLVLGSVLVWFLVFLIISRNDTLLSLLASISIVVTPFYQFWSFHKAEIPIFAGIIFVAGAYLFTSQNRRTLVLCSAILSWAGGCYMLAFIYPPFQVGIAYLLLFMLAGFVASNHRHIPIFRHDKHFRLRVGAGAVAVLITVGVAAAFYVCSRDVIEALGASRYPGKRFSTGGDMPWWWLLSNNYFVPLFHMLKAGNFSDAKVNWEPMGNICEYGSAWMFFPYIGLAMVWQKVVNRGRPRNWLAISILAYVCILLVYATVGFPRWLSGVSLFSRVPGNRVTMELVLANVVLLVVFLSDRTPCPGFSRRHRAGAAGVWALLLLFTGGWLCRKWPAAPGVWVLLVALLTAVLTYALLRPRRRVAFMVLVVGLTAVSSLWFNPVVRGGTRPLYDNPISEKMLAIDREMNGESVWGTFNSIVLANLPRTLGIKAINGNYPYPQLSLWKRIDPSESLADYYNRYGNAELVESPGEHVEFQLIYEDYWRLVLNPRLHIGLLRELGVTHLLVVSSTPEAFDNSGDLEKVFSFQDKHIYRVLSH